MTEPDRRVARPDRDAAARFLRADRAWAAYPLGHLDPASGVTTDLHATDTPAGIEALLVVAHLPSLVNLFATGSPSGVADTLRALPEVPASGVFSARGDTLEAMERHLQVTTAYRMRRMAVTPAELRGRRQRETKRLGLAHLEQVRRLYGLWTDSHQLPSQLDGGIYFGCFDGDELVAAAGTHAVSLGSGVAAIGNVLTHVGHRGRGLASTTTTAVAEELFRLGCEEVVLNVRQGNDIALDAYRKLGFREHCTFIEGVFRRR
ncbi:MAG: GNAT family N-acetyltransferase [Candidatus Dormibacteria bacterium]